VDARRTLDRLLSRLGLCSRTRAAELVRAGRVRVDGRVVRNPDTWVDVVRQRVELDGRPIEAARPLALLLNKPKGFVTSFGDPRGRRTVYDLLAGAPAWVAPVGRLDRDTSGLLLLTNDTELGERVANPEHGLGKRYRVVTKARVAPEDLARLAGGLELADGPTRPARAELVGHRGPTSVVELELHEGRNRQVRRMFLALGKPVKELKRVAIGPLVLGTLASGCWRALAPEELAALRAAVGLGRARGLSAR
jgi:pseudouridine synthase